MKTVGETLIGLLEAYGVELVFGIPGVHTIELYRGLARSTIRHMTPRHEQSAGFMADGYARVSGRPGVAFVITGPGLTNTITAMAQARADSIPMLVISGVNARKSLGKGLGFLHELPDQQGMLSTVALISRRVERGSDLVSALHQAFSLFSNGRGGPVHIEIPTDVMGELMADVAARPVEAKLPAADARQLTRAAEMLRSAQRPLILAGGGAKLTGDALADLATALDAPVVSTTNGRGLMHAHSLNVPASASLAAVRRLIRDSDCVLALGTEFGRTDYDMYADGGFAIPSRLIRVDIDQKQLDRHPASLAIRTDAAGFIAALLPLIAPRRGEGAARAEEARRAAHGGLDASMQAQIGVIETIRDALPGAIIVGDSTQPIYAGNLYYDHDRPGGWFNASTGYGALGYGPPAAIGAKLADPSATVVCLTGDGGLQFTLAELGSAVDAKAGVIFLVWNNRGYREIEISMRSAGVEPVGVSPAPPDFMAIAKAYGLSATRLQTLDSLAAELQAARDRDGPSLIEIGPDLVV